MKLSRLGRDRILDQKMDTFAGYLKGLGYGKLSKFKRGMLQKKLNDHMVGKRLWEETDANIERPYKKPSCRRLGRVAAKQKLAKKRKRSNVFSGSLSDKRVHLEKFVLRKKSKKA